MKHRRPALAVALAAVVIAVTPAPARALDGCKLLLCLAGPWRTIPQCVPDVTALFRDLARGRPFPSCSFVAAPDGSAAPTQAVNAWADGATCPPQYVSFVYWGESWTPTCRWTGAISVRIDGREWSRTWWSLDGGAVTEWSPEASRELGARADPTYAADLARFLETHPDGVPRPPDWQPGTGDN